MAVGPRVNKEEFMRALGLTTSSQDEQFYRAMRDEAIQIYNRMNQDRSNLLDSLRDDPRTQPPFYWHHIRPECQRWGILEIWRTASSYTRPYFDRGSTSGEYGPNWVAGWLLYSVFRSRDERNNRNRRRGNEAARKQVDLSHQLQQNQQQQQQQHVHGHGQQQEQGTKGYYDPVRNGTVN
ncbi:hypothetical protein SI65_00764 [Aspergillus cristatus]|uniref:Uncharacterized protein n=1 Tax=Aspergillus cristatus TaxID=573508 RepID=A0A1E3BQE7_ASPCR|nr:hypothetical protein SI65_00764 [Aspergillus cristatus]